MSYPKCSPCAPSARCTSSRASVTIKARKCPTRARRSTRAAVEAHFAWWRAVWEGQRARGFETITMTPEFGPDGYCHLEPYTQKPVADIWELNVWTGQRLRAEFARLVSGDT